MEDQSFLDNTVLPCGSLGPQEEISISDCNQRYGENIFKAHTCATDLPCQVAMQPYHQFTPNQPCSYQMGSLLESTTNFGFLRPTFCQLDQIPNTGSMSNILQWMSSNDFIVPQTVAPGLAFPFAAKASLTYPDHEFTLSLPTKTQSLSAPIRSTEISYCTGTSSSQLAGEQQESNKKAGVRSVHSGNSALQPYHPDFYKRPKKKPTSYNMSREKLHSSFKQAQFKCKTAECNRSFKRRDHLKRHMKTHSKEKTHDCEAPE